MPKFKGMASPCKIIETATVLNGAVIGGNCFIGANSFKLFILMKRNSLSSPPLVFSRNERTLPISYFIRSPLYPIRSPFPRSFFLPLFRTNFAFACDVYVQRISSYMSS